MRSCNEELDPEGWKERRKEWGSKVGMREIPGRWMITWSEEAALEKKREYSKGIKSGKKTEGKLKKKKK